MRSKTSLKNSTTLHELNYAKLLRVIPGIRSLLSSVYIQSSTCNYKVEINILEKTKYTTAFSITLIQHVSCEWLPNMCMVVRTYHDARVAEVINFQDHSRLLPLYKYPNSNMYQKNEKRQVNQFFGEWLSYCLDSQCIFDGNFEPVDA